MSHKDSQRDLISSDSKVISQMDVSNGDPQRPKSEDVTPSLTKVPNETTDQQQQQLDNLNIFSSSYDKSLTNNTTMVLDEDVEKRELDLWNEQNNLFFSNYFFPAADNYMMVTKLMNSAL